MKTYFLAVVLSIFAASGLFVPKDALASHDGYGVHGFAYKYADQYSCEDEGLLNISTGEIFPTESGAPSPKADYISWYEKVWESWQKNPNLHTICYLPLHLSGLERL